MSSHAQRGILFFSWFLISCLSAHAQFHLTVTNRPPGYDSLGVFRRALESASEAARAAPQSQILPSNVGCSAADAAEEPCPMRILFHGYPGRQWVTGLGTINSQGLSAITDMALGFGTTELSHDGGFVAYNDYRSSEWATYVVNLETSERRKVFPISPGRKLSRRPVVA